ncbi:MAG: amidohydrolase, partial [Dactylosporangium sp.]|nr:amidohydrolase [Dactylosporangium sp.]
MSTDRLAAELESLPLIDHHVHGACTVDLDRGALEQLLTESDRPIPSGTTQFDSQVGFAVRRWCAPVLGLDPHASPESYVQARRALGAEEVTRRLLGASGVAHF